MIKILVDDVGEGSIDRARKLLSGIPHGADKAVGSALKRASRTGMAYATRMLQREYVAGSGTMKSYTDTKIHYNNSAGGTTVDLEFRGHHIPLMKFDVSVGSRYITGVNVVNWPIGRVLMSYYASAYVRTVLGIKLRDTTAGFVCWSRKVLETICLDDIRFKGYAFQIEMKYTALRLGFKIKEVPVVFVNRELGTSKMSGGIFSEAFFGVLKLRFKKYKRNK